MSCWMLNVPFSRSFLVMILSRAAVGGFRKNTNQKAFFGKKKWRSGIKRKWKGNRWRQMRCNKNNFLMFHLNRHRGGSLSKRCENRPFLRSLFHIDSMCILRKSLNFTWMPNVKRTLTIQCLLYHEHLCPPLLLYIVSMCIWKRSELGWWCCVMKAGLLTARLSVWNTKRQCFSWIGFKQRQSNFGLTISWGGLWWLAQYVSGYFGWLWLMVSLGNQTHKRPMRLWPASLAGHGKEGGNKMNNKNWQKNEGLREGGKESSNSMPNAAYYIESDCNLSRLFYVCLCALRLTHLPEMGLERSRGPLWFWSTLSQTTQWPCQNCLSVCHR